MSRNNKPDNDSNDSQESRTKSPGSGQQLRKRFYKSVTTIARGHDWLVLLDGRTLRSPGRAELALPCEPLAQLVAREWEAQVDHIKPISMPVTRLSNSALDGVATRLAEVRADIVRYAGNDLICFRADHPDALTSRQAGIWDPILRWARDRHNICLTVSSGVMPVHQTAQALGAFEAAIDPVCETAFTLAALHIITTITGSALLALAFVHQRLSVNELWRAAHVDEDWQIERWGADEEAVRRLENRKNDMVAAANVLKILVINENGD